MVIKLCRTSLSRTSLFSCDGAVGTGKISFVTVGLTDGGISISEGEGGDVGEGGETESIFETPGVDMG